MTTVYVKIVGIYNEFSDEPAENAELVRRYGS